MALLGLTNVDYDSEDSNLSTVSVNSQSSQRPRRLQRDRTLCLVYFADDNSTVIDSVLELLPNKEDRVVGKSVSVTFRTKHKDKVTETAWQGLVLGIDEDKDVLNKIEKDHKKKCGSRSRLLEGEEEEEDRSSPAPATMPAPGGPARKGRPKGSTNRDKSSAATVTARRKKSADVPASAFGDSNGILNLFNPAPPVNMPPGNEPETPPANGADANGPPVISPQRPQPPKPTPGERIPETDQRQRAKRPRNNQMVEIIPGCGELMCRSDKIMLVPSAIAACQTNKKLHMKNIGKKLSRMVLKSALGDRAKEMTIKPLKEFPDAELVPPALLQATRALVLDLIPVVLKALPEDMRPMVCLPQESRAFNDLRRDLLKRAEDPNDPGVQNKREANRKRRDERKKENEAKKKKKKTGPEAAAVQEPIPGHPTSPTRPLIPTSSPNLSDTPRRSPRLQRYVTQPASPQPSTSRALFTAPASPTSPSLLGQGLFRPFAPSPHKTGLMGATANIILESMNAVTWHQH